MAGLTAIVAGASGLVGSHCVQGLLNDVAYEKVRILVRRELPLQHEKLEQVKVNFDQLAQFQAALQGDHLFCCLGTTIKQVGGSQAEFFKVDFTYPHRLGQIARENDVKRYLLVSALGANAKSLIFYNRVKGDVEQALSDLGFEALQIFQPSFLMGERTEHRTGEKLGIQISEFLRPWMKGGLKKYRPIEAQAVARAMIYCAKQPARGIQRILNDEIQAIADAQSVRL